MRLSELLGSSAFDASGARVGTVHDCRMGTVDGGLEITALVIGSGTLARLAHAAGFAAGHAEGPRLLRTLTKRAVRHSRLLPAEHVRHWSPGRIEFDGPPQAIRPLAEVLEL